MFKTSSALRETFTILNIKCVAILLKKKPIVISFVVTWALLHQQALLVVQCALTGKQGTRAKARAAENQQLQRVAGLPGHSAGDSRAQWRKAGGSRAQCAAAEYFLCTRCHFSPKRSSTGGCVLHWDLRKEWIKGKLSENKTRGGGVTHLS